MDDPRYLEAHIQGGNMIESANKFSNDVRTNYTNLKDEDKVMPIIKSIARPCEATNCLLRGL